MTKNVLFYLWRNEQQLKIEQHSFYFNEAKKRLLSQFDNIEQDADIFAEEWLDKNAHRFNPDFDDAGSFCGSAYDEAGSYYISLQELQRQTYLSVAAGLYHQWDKALRKWLVKEVEHWSSNAALVSALWRVDFGKLVELMDALNWQFSNTSYASDLDIFRLVVNAYKHGEGAAFEQLKKGHPEFIVNPYSGINEEAAFDKNIMSGYTDYSYLAVSMSQLEAFLSAIICFWKSIPEYTYDSDVNELPDWFSKFLK